MLEPVLVFGCLDQGEPHGTGGSSPREVRGYCRASAATVELTEARILMGASTLDELLQLPGPERVQLAMALWHSLETTEQEQALTVDAGLATELERRWAEHQQHPERAVSWDVVRQDLGLA